MFQQLRWLIGYLLNVDARAIVMFLQVILMFSLFKVTKNDQNVII